MKVGFASRDVVGVLGALADQEQSRKAWVKAAISYPGLVVTTEKGELCGGCLLIEGTEPQCGGWLLHLRHFVTTPEYEPQDLLQPLAEFARLYGTPPNGWITIDSDCSSRFDSALESAGFEVMTLGLRLSPLTEPEASGSIRPATFEDTEDIRRLSSLCLPEIVAVPPGGSLSNVLRYSQDHWPTYSQECNPDDQYMTFLVSLGPCGKVQGFVSLGFYRPEPWVDDMAVDPMARGTPVARSLLKAAVAHCAEQGYNELRAVVASSNPRSWKPALRYGFKVVERRWIQRFENRKPSPLNHFEAGPARYA